MTRLLYILFILSGAAGLFYESIWTRYLGLLVGHGAYAQIIVLVIFLGGMSLGAAAVSRRSARMRQPLQGYAAVELVVGLIGLVFHDVFGAASAFAYTTLFPAVAGSPLLPVAKWSLASALILPQSILLGATFPLMSAGVLRLAPQHPGRTLSLLYFANSFGAAAGVLVAGFWLVHLAGLPGTLLAAAMLNLVVALATMCVVAVARQRPAPASAAPVTAMSPATAPLPPLARLRPLLLGAAFGTAVASFIYELDWIRMLSLVLGSATHSFELMLSAFILGLALGSHWIRARADRLADPLRTLGIVQWAMGLLALATLPIYAASFEWLGALMQTFTRTDAGYTGFTVARYAICLAVMLPATFCAGMTLPLLTRTLLVAGEGERAIGTVYAWNTLGSIVGVALGGLVLLPVLGLKGMLVAGALLDIAIGIVLLRAAAGHRPATRRLAWAAAAVALVAVAGIGGLTRLEHRLLVSGVFRRGRVAKPEESKVVFYRDGRTATVSATRTAGSGTLSLATNGKTDASLRPVWFSACDSTTRRATLVTDEGTQTLLPLVAMAHAPQARQAAVIGQGSGMTSHLLLGNPRIERLVTVEIEPEMIQGSRVFHPANRRVFEDPRSTIAIDDAKSYFAAAQQRFDLIVSEPSNPWVSGVSGLFTEEFYRRIKDYLTEDGVFGQWLQIYELDDPLVLSVLAAVHQVFPSYEVFLVPGTDLLVLASNRPVPTPDWSVVDLPSMQGDLCRFRPLTSDVLESLRLVDRTALAPLLDGFAQPNSDYYPVLDLGAERRRFLGRPAVGVASLAADWFSFMASLHGRRAGPDTATVAALPENPRVSNRATGALARRPDGAGPLDSTASQRDREVVYRAAQWRAALAADRPPVDWMLWVEQARQVMADRNGGTAGYPDQELHAQIARYLDRHDAPATARDVVTFRHALAAWDFAAAASAADRVLPVAMKEREWIGADELRDGAVFAKLHVGDPAGARRFLDTLRQFTVRRREDARNQLLEAYVAAATRSDTAARP